MYKVVLKTAAEKVFKTKLDRKIQEKVGRRIDLLSENPFSPNSNLNKLQGVDKGYRLRIGDLRIVYHVDTNNKTITIWKIDFRGSVYKK